MVALFTRAWIEMTALSENLYSARVALFTRAWIEMTQKGKIDVDILVALFTRAWIEITLQGSAFICGLGRPLHEGVD